MPLREGTAYVETMMTGMSGQRIRLRERKSAPLSLGICQSVITTSTTPLNMGFNASYPSAARWTSYSACSSRRPVGFEWIRHLLRPELLCHGHPIVCSSLSSSIHLRKLCIPPGKRTLGVISTKGKAHAWSKPMRHSRQHAQQHGHVIGVRMQAGAPGFICMVRQGVMTVIFNSCDLAQSRYDVSVHENPLCW